MRVSLHNRCAMTHFTTRPEIVGTHGVAASTHWLASQTAMGVLERGGNAFDAAVAGGFVLQVVEPHLNGPGGEVPLEMQAPPRRCGPRRWGAIPRWWRPPAPAHPPRPAPRR